MARNALSHEPFLGGQALRIFHLPVTLPAGNFAVDMSLMIEQHMFGYIIYLYPGRRGPAVEILVFFLDPGMFFNNIVVAMQTFFHRRNSRKIRVGHIWVAVLALYLFDPAVHIVAEGDRLFRAETEGRPTPEDINKARGCQ